ncbi:two-component sensor histidine kinase [Phytohabitans rumicis]|uniref:histidine kinase n=1 Tax=Phytohabitans rumicis TaxID=1076125 RepID=A0A6V8KXE8_9ACTN|nr:two-component sensor histidine kinase [Phytohabitans rumicis]
MRGQAGTGVDIAFGAAIALLFLVAVAVSPDDVAPQASPVATLVAAAVTFATIASRRRYPIPALLTAAMAALAARVVADTVPALMVALVVTAYTMAARTGRRTAWPLGCGVAMALYLSGAILGEGGWWAPENLGSLAWVGMAVAFGDATRSRRAYVAEVEERARRAEHSRDEEARRRVAEERLRIARELHDVVAHHIAVINVQAGAAAHVLHSRPDVVGTALAHIRHESDTVVKELGAVVGFLRQPDESSTEPTRGLARLEDLLASMATAGLTVRCHQQGNAYELPTVTDLAAYRIVQEALTNAHKHGTGGAHLTITYRPHAVAIEITNPIHTTTPPSAGGGYGLIGMRERASAAGGVLTTATGPDGAFHVQAVLPSAPNGRQS